MSTTETKPVLAEGSSAAAPAPVAEAPLLAPVIAVEEPKETTSAIVGEPKAAVAPEVLAAPASEPIKAEPVEKQPTTTHAESGTAHADAEVATKIDGTTDKTAAVEPEAEATKKTETTSAPVAEGSKTGVEEPKKKDEAKKVAVKEKVEKTKVEKTKVEGKGFFAKIFGSKEKSPKKQKVKTPKVEKSDPIAVEATTAEPTAETTTETAPVETTRAAEASTSTSVPEVTGAAITTDSAVPAPAHAEAPAVPTMDTKPEILAAKEAEAAAPAPAAVVETSPETAAVSAVGETKESTAAKEETPNPRNVKATRRLSSRFTSFVHKIGGKKDGTTTPPKEDKEEPLKETTESHIVSNEAPKLDEPTPAAPLKMDETKSTPPPAGAVVSSTA